MPRPPVPGLQSQTVQASSCSLTSIVIISLWVLWISALLTSVYVGALGGRVMLFWFPSLCIGWLMLCLVAESPDWGRAQLKGRHALSSCWIVSQSPWWSLAHGLRFYFWFDYFYKLMKLFLYFSYYPFRHFRHVNSIFFYICNSQTWSVWAGGLSLLFAPLSWHFAMFLTTNHLWNSRYFL